MSNKQELKNLVKSFTDAKKEAESAVNKKEAEFRQRRRESEAQ